MVRVSRYERLSVDFLIRDMNERIARVKKHLSPEREQVTHFQLSHMYVSLGFIQYGGGFAYHEVLSTLRIATESFTRVFQLKGTTPESMIRTKQRGSGQPHETGSIEVKRKPDYGYTNSKEAIFGIMISLLCNRPLRSREIASLAGGPPEASLANDRFLEGALVAYLHDDPERAKKVLDQMGSENSWYEDLRQLFLAIINKSATSFVNTLDGLLRLHVSEAEAEHNRIDPLYNLCYHAVGLATLALQSGVFQSSQLPDRPPYFPRELIEFSLSHPT